MFDLEKNGAFREPTKAELREEKDREYNGRMKNTMRFIGENMATCTIVLVSILLVGSVFGELGFNVFNKYLVLDFILTFAGLLTIEYLASKSGVRCGKTYDEYIKLHDIYLSMREAIYKRGITLMDMFCDWQVDVEYEYYIRRMCKRLKIDYNTYLDVYSKMSLEEISDMLTHKGEEKPKFTLKSPIRSAIAVYRYGKISNTAKNIFYLRSIQHITLTPEILLTDGKPGRGRGGVAPSGQEHLERKTTGAGHIIAVAITVACTIIPLFLLYGWSWTMLFSAVLKLASIFWRYYSGYSKGAQAFNTVEVKHISDKVQYFHLYNEFLDKKFFIKLKEKYGSRTAPSFDEELLEGFDNAKEEAYENK